MAGIVRFCMGNLNTYLKDKNTANWSYKDALFFDTVSKQIYLNGDTYSGNSEDSSFDINTFLASYGTIINTVTSNTNNGISDGYEFIFTDITGNDTNIVIPLVTNLISGVMSSSDKIKLDNINPNQYVIKEEGKGLSTNDFTDVEKEALSKAQENVIEAIQIDGVNITVDDNKIVNLEIAQKVEDIISDHVSSAYTYKGSVKSAASLVDIEIKEIGDVYNIEEASEEYGAAGVNVAWNGTSWDSLGGIFSASDITGDINALDSKVNNIEGRVISLEIVNTETRLTNLETQIQNITGTGADSITAIAQNIVNTSLKWEIIE